MAKVTLDQWIKKIEYSSRMSVERVTNEALDNIIDTTPKLTGQARSNWRVRDKIINKPDKSTKIELNRGEQKLKIPALARAFVEKSKEIVISNALDYIRGLEYGRSRKSEAMVRRTIQKLSNND